MFAQCMINRRPLLNCDLLPDKSFCIFFSVDSVLLEFIHFRDAADVNKREQDGRGRYIWTGPDLGPCEQHVK